MLARRHLQAMFEKSTLARGQIRRDRPLTPFAGKKGHHMSKKKAPALDPSKLAIGRHNGEHIWGYEVFGDGRIQLSPGFADQFRRVLDREAGVRHMQENITRFVADELTRLSKERREWWDHLTDDAGIDRNKKYVFDARTGSVMPEEEEAPPPSPQATAQPEGK